jgi:geranylgeranyl pyrophosphate synthase
MLLRKFSNENDIENSIKIVNESNGIIMTKKLAATHCYRAIEKVLKFEDSPSRSLLIELIGKVLERSS